MVPENELLVDLFSFRKRNGLLQQDVADFLGVTRGYISLVEKGKSKLSSISIDKILDSSREMHWDTEDLVPAYTRLCRFLYYSKEEVYAGRKNKPFQIIGMPRFKYGREGISERLADSIIHDYPEVSRDWLITGEGKMLVNPNYQQEKKTLSDSEVIMKKLADLKTEMMEMMEILAERIINEVKQGRA